MKKIIVSVLLLVLIGAYFYYSKEPRINIVNGIKSGSYILHVKVPESDGAIVTFSNTSEFADKKFTESEFSIENSSAKGSVVALLENIEPLGIKRFLLPYFVNYGGSGTFLYVGLFSIENSTLKHLDSLFIGDRIELLKITAVDNMKAVLEYNGYKDDKAMSTVPDKYTKIDLLLKGNKFLKIITN